jgi:hypothetical protein
MSTDRERAGEPGRRGATGPSPDEVASRAEGRPPEERSSEDPTSQAEAILEESEDRVSERAEEAEPPQSN